MISKNLDTNQRRKLLLVSGITAQKSDRLLSSLVDQRVREPTITDLVIFLDGPRSAKEAMLPSEEVAKKYGLLKGVTTLQEEQQGVEALITRG